MNSVSAPVQVGEAPPQSRAAAAVGATWKATRQFRPVLLLLVLLLVVLSVSVDSFATVSNIENLTTSVSILWVIALGATFVQLSGGIDLSSGAVAALAGICLAKLLATALPDVLTIVLVVCFGAVVGAIANGILIGLYRVNVFVVTLGSMTAITGVVNLWSGTNSTFVSSAAVSALSVDRELGLPTPIWVMIISFLIFLFVQSRTYFGRDVYAVGGSLTAATLSGIRAPRTLIWVYAVAGAMAALAGIIAVGRIGAAAPQPDNTLPLNAIAAILLGGTALTGGIGGVGGTALGVLFIGTLQNGLSLSGAPTYWQQIVTGVILVAAVVANRFQTLPAWARGGRGLGRPASTAGPAPAGDQVGPPTRTT